IARALLPEAFLQQTLNPLNVDLRTLAVTAVVGVLGSVFAGSLPAWMATRIGVGESLRVVDRGSAETTAERTFTRGLLVVEVALACTLLAGATLLVRSFVNLAAADRGVDVSGIVTASVSLPAKTFADPQARASVARLMEQKAREIPGVEHAAWSYGTPPNGGGFTRGDWRPDTADAPVSLTAEHYYVGPDFFALYRIPLLRGRTFLMSDADHHVVMGERLANIFWPCGDPIGRAFYWPRSDKQYHVIGVVKELNFPTVEAGLNRPEFYLPFQGVDSYAMLSMRCFGACPDAAVVRQRLGRAHPAAQLVEVGRLEDKYATQLSRPRAAAALGFSFALVSSLAAAGGLFSVLTYTVGRRRREFAIRAALGAAPSELRWSVLREGVAVAVAGLAIGAVGALSLSDAFASLRYGVSPSDPVSLGVVAALIAGTVLIATWRPAYQAMRVDPLRALREE
ncbi:MAG TPA: FtsX-like permease family protein, partial [Vicinamibacterales bacterium]|nr:FtsX-like permease family protein [Vicinamibacterales bacterium]